MSGITVLTHDEQRRVIHASYQHPMGIQIRFLMSTGITVTELLNLRWMDIDVLYGRVYIAGERALQPGLYDPEALSQRSVPILPHLVKELMDWKAIQECACPKGTCMNSRPVAATLNGQILTEGALQNCLHEILRSCNMPCYPLSALRDTYAVRALEQGMNPLYLNIVMGDPSAAKSYSQYIANETSASMALMETLYTVRPEHTVNLYYLVVASVLEDGSVDLFALDFPWEKLHTDNLPVGMNMIKNRIGDYLASGAMPTLPTNALYIDCQDNQYLLLLCVVL